MSVSRTVLAATAGWLAVVAVGSVLVWSVISRAGDVEPGPGTAVPAGIVTPSGPAPSVSESRSASKPPSKAPSRSTSPSPSPSSAATSDGPSPGVDAERRTWQGPGGYVSVECRGQAIALVAAQADAGFVVEVEDRGPEEVKVAFEGQGEEGRESEVKAVCRSGVPDFEVSSDDGS